MYKSERTFFFFDFREFSNVIDPSFDEGDEETFELAIRTRENLLDEEGTANG